MKLFKFSVPALATCLVLAACAAQPELVAKSAAVPADVDFSGNWQLQKDPDARPKPAGDAGMRIRIPTGSSQRGVERRQQQRSSGSSVQVFLESGDLLKISQTHDGLFISFDRAVVEEYTFGENRVISVGPIEAQRVSGWQGRNLVIETLDSQGTILSESWHIDTERDVLVREISVSKGVDKKFSSRQQFERI